MALSDVTNCRLDINESRHEITYNDKDGKNAITTRPGMNISMISTLSSM